MNCIEIVTGEPHAAAVWVGELDIVTNRGVA